MDKKDYQFYNNITVKEERIQKEEVKSKEIIYHHLKDCKIKTMDINSKFTIFFILKIPKNYHQNIDLSIFLNDGFFVDSFINYEFIFLKENNYGSKSELS